MSWLIPLLHALCLGCYIFALYCSWLGVDLLSGRVAKRLCPDVIRRFYMLLGVMLFGMAVMFAGHSLLGYCISSYTWGLAWLDAWIAHNDDRWKRWRKKLKSVVKLKKFDSRPLGRPLPYPT